MMILPVPVEIEKVLYVNVDIQSPSVDCLAQSRSIADEGKYFPALRAFVAGCVRSFTTEDGRIVDDSVSIRSILPKLPFRSVDYIAIQALLLDNDDDGIEGFYPCPRCGTESIAEYREDDGIVLDTRDRISSLKVGVFDPYVDKHEIRVDLSEPVVISDRGGDVMLQIENFEVAIPTLENCIVAESKVGAKDPVKLQIAIYVEAMTKVNGEKIDNKFRNEYGNLFMGKIRTASKDLRILSDTINRYGIDRRVDKECKKCGKKWRPVVNTSNFFDSTPLV
jgi:exosome complex RNA-binding protein Csl4